MKYSLHSRQTKEYLAQADEIMVSYRDREQLLDLIAEFPDAEYVLSCNENDNVEESEIKKYETMLKNKLILCFYDLDYALFNSNQEQYPIYYGFPITTLYELHLLINNLHPTYVILGAELLHSIDKVKDILKNTNIKIRCAPTVANYYPYWTDGIAGSWIRPEDLDSYEDIVDLVEFPIDELSKERALFRVYKQDKKWPGRLDLLISDLSTSAINRMIPPGSLDCRKNCKQACITGGACRICNRILMLADPSLFKQQEQSDEREL